MRTHYWADLGSNDFSHTGMNDVLAVLPLGAIEQHGPHLPLSVDCDIVAEIIRRSIPIIGDLEVLFLPIQAIGKSNEHQHFPGTLSLDADSLLATVMGIGAGVARAGVRKLLLFNGHGGNTGIIEIAARDLRAHYGLNTAYCSWSSITAMDDLFSEVEIRHGIHGGEIETSLMLALRPGAVNIAEARDFRSASQDWEKDYRKIGFGPGRARPGWLTGDLNTEGACGNADAASAKTGEILFERAATSLAELLREMLDFDPA